MRTSLLVAAVAVALAAGAPSSTSATGVCHGYHYSMTQALHFAKAILPVPTARDDRELRRVVHCMKRPDLRDSMRRWVRAHQLRLGEHVWANSTAYSECDSGTTTSMGTHVHFGEVAVIDGTLPLGTWIYMDRPVLGRRLFRVEDHIGWGSELDIFMDCGSVDWWGRRDVGYRVVVG